MSVQPTTAAHGCSWTQQLTHHICDLIDAGHHLLCISSQARELPGQLLTSDAEVMPTLNGNGLAQPQGEFLQKDPEAAA
jgi:hypothetical protein